MEPTELEKAKAAHCAAMERVGKARHAHAEAEEEMRQAALAEGIAYRRLCELQVRADLAAELLKDAA